jgi:hypothetical protein
MEFYDLIQIKSFIQKIFFSFLNHFSVTSPTPHLATRNNNSSSRHKLNTIRVQQPTPRNAHAQMVKPFLLS